VVALVSDLGGADVVEGAGEPGLLVHAGEAPAGDEGDELLLAGV
jgi:hypothetical protein